MLYSEPENELMDCFVSVYIGFEETLEVSCGHACVFGKSLY